MQVPSEGKECQIPLEQELQPIESCLTWVRGAELESSARWYLLLTTEQSLQTKRQISTHHLTSIFQNLYTVLSYNSHLPKHQYFLKHL